MEEKNSDREANRYAHDVLDGGSVTEIPVAFLGRVRSVLASWKVDAIQKGQTQVLRRLQSLIAQINGRENKNCNRRAVRSSQAVTPRETPRFSEEELDAVLDSYVESGHEENIPSDMLLSLISRSSKKVRDFRDGGDLIKAQKYDDAHKQLITIKNGESTRQNQAKKKRELEELLENVKLHLEEEKNELAQHLAQHNEEVEQSRQLHKAEWQELMEKWNRDAQCNPIPPEYRRYSVTLLNLRKTEAALIETRRFEEAYDLRAEVDELEKFEQQENRKRFDDAMQKRKQLLEEKYKHKAECLEQNAERNRTRIEHEHNSRIQVIELSISNLEKKIKNMEGENLTTTKTEPLRKTGPLSAHRPRTSMAPSRPTSARVKANRGECPKREAVEKVKVGYRPIMSKWRIQSPESMAPVTRGVRKC
jgi:hypothetical protein